jgi:hypothetical protein
MQHASAPYTLLLDADVVLVDPQTAEKMIAYLEEFPDLAVAVDTKGMSEGRRARATAIGHTVIACLMIRKEVLDMLDFEHLVYTTKNERRKELACIREFKEYDACLCSYVNARIAQLGRIFNGPVEIPYLRGISAKEEKNGQRN